MGPSPRRATSTGGPLSTTRPPASPPPGPRSTSQSAASATAASCSTTTTVLPASTRPWSSSQQPFDVGRVQARRGLVQHVERPGEPGALELGGQLDALRLPAGQLGRRLPEAQVAQPDVPQRRQPADGGRDVVEGVHGGVDVQVQHVGDGPAPVGHLERLRGVAGPVAGGADRVGAGQEQHPDGQEPLALAGGAAARGDVEGEPARAPAAPPWPPASWRTWSAPRRRAPCRWRGWSAAYARSGAGRPAPAGGPRPGRPPGSRGGRRPRRPPRRPRGRRRPARRPPPGSSSSASSAGEAGSPR